LKRNWFGGDQHDAHYEGRPDVNQGVEAITIRGLNKILQNLFEEHFKDGTKISSHSFRIGMTESLAERGVGLVELQQADRWARPVMPYEYTKNQTVSRGTVAKMYQQVE